jgi:hypothetical protein
VQGEIQKTLDVISNEALIETNQSVLKNASGRLAAMNAHRAELEKLSGASAVASQQDYLETLVDLSIRRVVFAVHVPGRGPCRSGLEDDADA